MSLKENFERKNKDLVSEIQKLKNEKKLKSETEAELLSIIQMFEDNLRQKEKELTEKFENEKSDLIEEINRLQNIIKELENNNLQSNPSNQVN